MKIHQLLLVMISTCLVACSSGLPDGLVLPDGGEQISTDFQHNMEAPSFTYAYDITREELWEKVPRLLRDEGWIVIFEDNPPIYIIAGKDGQIVAIATLGDLADFDKNRSDILIQVGNPYPYKIDQSCSLLERCLEVIDESGAAEEGSKLAKGVRMARLGLEFNTDPAEEYGSSKGCRDDFMVLRAKIRDYVFESEKAEACYAIPLDYSEAQKKHLLRSTEL